MYDVVWCGTDEENDALTQKVNRTVELEEEYLKIRREVEAIKLDYKVRFQKLKPYLEFQINYEKESRKKKALETYKDNRILSSVSNEDVDKYNSIKSNKDVNVNNDNSSVSSDGMLSYSNASTSAADVPVPVLQDRLAKLQLMLNAAMKRLQEV